MTNPTTPFNWQMPTSTDLVTDLPADFETFGQAVATSMADLLGGTTGQVLSKASNTDMDFTWVAQDDSNAIQNAIVDAKGDLIAATAADTPARLAVGTNGHVLTADSTTATGLKWAAAAGGGKVLQVVHANYNVQVSNSTNVYADTGLTATITPTATTSKILVLVSQNGLFKSSNSSNNACNIKLLRGATQLAFAYSTYLDQIAQTIFHPGISFNYLDSPNTTSATTYKTQFANDVNGASVRVQHSSQNDSQITLMEIGA